MIYSHLRMLFLICLFAVGAGASLPVTYLDRLKDQGYLKIAVLKQAHISFASQDGLSGFHYDLAKLFAKHIGVQVQVTEIEHLRDGIQLLEAGSIDLLASGVIADPSIYPQLSFAPSLQTIETRIVYRRGNKPPKDIKSAIEQGMLVTRGSNESSILRQLQAEQPTLSWQEVDLLTPVDLLKRVVDRQLNSTLMTDDQFVQLRDYFPSVKAIIPDQRPDHKPQSIAWAVRKQADQSLLRATYNFLEQPEMGFVISSLNERYYGHLQQIDRVSAYYFKRQINRTLPKYRHLFETYADQFDMDWRLLAAMGYQESHWRANARSRTGVRGLMMLTRITASELGIENRLDPENSVRGGAEYIAKLLRRLPDDVRQPDRTWFALAAYNVGYGHLDDARQLTEKLGGDSRQWVDVKEVLPLLRDAKYHRLTKHGYARGNEPVTYVQNIRRYYDMLAFADEKVLTLASNQEEMSPNIQIIPPLL